MNSRAAVGEMKPYGASFRVNDLTEVPIGASSLMLLVLKAQAS